MRKPNFMKPMKKYYSVICLLLSLFCSWTVNAQNRHNDQLIIDSYSGCWAPNDSSEERLVTMQDKTFQWTNRTGSKDTLQGRWRIASRMGIPFKATVIILKFSNGVREMYEVDHTTMTTIYLGEKRRFSRAACNF